MDRAIASGAIGREFESLRAHQIFLSLHHFFPGSLSALRRHLEVIAAQQGCAANVDWGSRSRYGVTRKFWLLSKTTVGVVTCTLPEVAPAGTVAVIPELETTVNAAAVPLKVTPVAPVKLVPRITTDVPTAPEVVWVFTNGPRPIDKL